MTQLYRVELEGIDITENVDSTNISRMANRLYNTASLEVDDTIIADIKGRTIEIFYGSSTFSGLVFSVSKVSKKLYNIKNNVPIGDRNARSLSNVILL